VLVIVLLDFDFLEGLFDPDDVQVVPVATESPLLLPVMPDFFLCGSTMLSSGSDVLLGAMSL
jgi:hypothetical protein